MSSLISVVKALRDRTGATMIEFALALPVLLMLIFGALDLAWVAYQWNAASKATQWGARWAVVNPPMSATLQTQLASTAYILPDDLGKWCGTSASNCSGALPDLTTCTATTCTMGTILAQMRGVFPLLDDNNVVVEYRRYTGDQQLGFVGRPGGAPMRVTVRYSCQTFNWFFLVGLMQWVLPTLPPACGTGRGMIIPASYTLSSESFFRPS
jgi:Flp pilus assembly pilin Flp